jgi:hypothetical protein
VTCEPASRGIDPGVSGRKKCIKEKVRLSWLRCDDELIAEFDLLGAGPSDNS